MMFYNFSFPDKNMQLFTISQYAQLSLSNYLMATKSCLSVYVLT